MQRSLLASINSGCESHYMWHNEIFFKKLGKFLFWSIFKIYTTQNLVRITKIISLKNRKLDKVIISPYQKLMLQLLHSRSIHDVCFILIDINTDKPSHSSMFEFIKISLWTNVDMFILNCVNIHCNKHTEKKMDHLVIVCLSILKPAGL